MLRLALLVLCWAGAASAEVTLSPDQFDRMSTGKTMEFERDGAWYGSEQYLPNREVVWKYGDGTCTSGFWFEDQGSLCFVYEDAPQPQCWVFVEREGDFFARPAESTSGTDAELRLSRQSEQPLACAAPDLGV